jgi:shikimate kinase
MSKPKVIILYGAPAVGKYTIGKLLAEKLEIKFIHNHLLINPLYEISESGSEVFKKLVYPFRKLVTKELLREKISFITTIAFGLELGLGKKKSEKSLQNYCDDIVTFGGIPIVVHLHAKESELLKRVESEDRKNMQKLHKEEILKSFIKEFGVCEKADISYFQKSIDCSKFSPEQVARKIKKLHFLSEKDIENGNVYSGNLETLVNAL